jgi:hypothetical protein
MLSPQTGRPYYLLALAAIRFFVVGREKRIGAWLLLPFFAVLPLLSFLVEARVWHPLFFIATGLCGVVLGRIEGWRRWGVCLCLLVPQALRSAFRAHIDAAERQAGMWLWQHGEPDEVVLDRKPFVAYYSGLTQGWPPPQEGLMGLRKTLDQYEAAVLVVDNRYFRRSCQAWFEALQCPPD